MKKMINLSVRVPEALDRLVERKAVRDGIPKSEVIRIALMRYLVEEQQRASTREEGADLQALSPVEEGTPPEKGAE